MTAGRSIVVIGFALGGAVAAFGGCDAFEEPTGSALDGGASTDVADVAAPDVTDGPPLGPCNERPITAWTTPRRLTELRGSDGAIHFVDPFVTADGLTLWASKLSGDRWVAYRATRASRDVAWSCKRGSRRRATAARIPRRRAPERWS